MWVLPAVGAGAPAPAGSRDGGVVVGRPWPVEGAAAVTPPTVQARGSECHTRSPALVAEPRRELVL